MYFVCLRRLAAPALMLAVGLSAVDAAAQVRPSRPTATPTAPNQPPPAPAKGEKTIKEQARGGARFHMDFDKVDILEVIKYLSQWTGRNFILPENVRGKITIIGPSLVTADEAYAAFLAALESNNLTITPTGKFLKIVPKKDSIRTDIPFIIGDERVPPDERMVTKLVRLEYSEPDPIKNVLQQFISREGEITSYAPDILIISDTALNIRRIDKLIEQLDQPGSADEINVLQIYHASAQEMSNILLQVFQQQQGGTAGAQRPIPAPREVTPRRGARTSGTAATATADTGASAYVSKIIPDERSNKLIVIGSARSYERIRELVKKLDVPTDTGQVHVHYLENADAEELASTLQALAQGQSSATSTRTVRPTPGTVGATAAAAPATPAGPSSAALFSGEIKITAEKGTNSLLIIASPSDYRNLQRVIERLDIRRNQVFIEAAIMEVNLQGENTFSIDLHTGFAIEDVQLPGTASGTAPGIIGSEVSGAGRSLSIANLASLTGFLAGIQGPPVELEGLGISLPSFGVVLNALQTNSDVNVISTPHILTSDNEEAEITVGQNVPFQAAYAPSLGGLSGLTDTTGAGSLGLGGLLSASIGGLGSLYAPIQRQPVELRLKLKPQINEGDYIRLEVDEQVEEIVSVNAQLGPTTAKRSIKTVVSVKDQTSIVIGGLIQERINNGETKVPVLGSLPLIGALFRSTTATKTRTNLLLVLTPYIIRDQADFRRIFERKLKERQEFVQRFFGQSDQYVRAPIDFERKRGPLAVLRRAVVREFEKAENGGPGAPGEHIIVAPPTGGSRSNGDEGPIELPPGSAPNGGEFGPEDGAEPAPDGGAPGEFDQGEPPPPPAPGTGMAPEGIPEGSPELE